MNDITNKNLEQNLHQSDDQIARLKKELFLEKQLVKKLKQTQEDWSDLIEKVQPTIKALSDKIKELRVNLHLKNQELTNVLQSLSNGLIVTDLAGIIQTFNRAAVSITGFNKEAAIGSQINRLFGDDVLPAKLNDAALNSISKGYSIQFTLYKQGDEKIVVESSTTLMKSDENESQGIIINLVDITQLKRLKEEAERNNRLTAMGEIAMQVAHELRNPLGSIELFVSMMKMDFQPDSDEIILAHHIGSAAASMNHIISNLLEYTKPRPIVLDELNLHSLINQFVDFSAFSAEQHHIKVSLDLRAENQIITGNEELLKQVFHNLFINACQAMPEGGELKLSTDNIVETDPLILERFNNNRMLKADEISLIKVTFEDTGKGMTEEVKKKIFDPFFTTREQGTGLGMSIVNNTMMSHGGTILVDSSNKDGTRIELLFPQSTD